MVKEENKMKVILIGKTGAGKTSIAKELEKLGYPRLITDTTRPMREGEKDGVDYNFIDIEQFLLNVRMKHYAEYTYFNTKFGRWYYGSKISSYDETGDKCIVLTPDGARSVLAMTNSRDDILIVYIKVRPETLSERLRKRGDDPQEARRRLLADEMDFVGAENLADLVLLEVLNPEAAAKFIVEKVKERVKNV